MYAAQAARLAEHCGRITAKEAAKREAVNRWGGGLFRGFGFIGEKVRLELAA
jgi:hypothetical protein